MSDRHYWIPTSTGWPAHCEVCGSTDIGSMRPCTGRPTVSLESPLDGLLVTRNPFTDAYRVRRRIKPEEPAR